jgi:type III pantothenate kinase
MNVIFVEVGNSRTKIAYLENDNYDFISATFNDQLDDDFFSELSSFNLNPAKIYFASVTSSGLNSILLSLLTEYFDIIPVVLTTQKQCCGVVNGYQDFAKLGVDRWLSILVATDIADKAIIISAGTAITVDLVIDRVHKGGFIVPGLHLMRKMVVEDLDLVNFEQITDHVENSLLPNTTRDAVLGGTLYMVAAFLNTVIEDFKLEEVSDLKIIASGGDFAKIRPLLSYEVEEITDLVIQGMIKVFKS